MVIGLPVFKEHFRGFENSYVLIGGTACDALMERFGLRFRKTKDLDIVLLVEALTPGFVERLKEFVEAGQYEQRQRQTTGAREFFRFVRPKREGYPFMLELFSRSPEGLELAKNQNVVPVAVEETVASLSAILMDASYYSVVSSYRQSADGVTVLGAGGLIPLKARAWLDLRERKESGKEVDDDDIKKHRNDVFRMALTLTGDDDFDLPAEVRADLKRFVGGLPEGSPEWTGIIQALKEITPGGTTPSPKVLLETLMSAFHLD